MVTVLIMLGIVVVALIYIISLYNNLVQLKHGVSKAWANIDVLLKQRHDELPKLVEVCKQYKQFEQETLQRVIAARSQVQTAREGQDVEALGKAEGVLRTSVSGLFAVAEAYPELKSNEHFMQLQTRISGLENGIADRREVYNESVNIYNIGIEQFPAVMLASTFNFPPKPLLEFASAEKMDVDIKTLFN
jgi:LemA protein